MGLRLFQKLRLFQTFENIHSSLEHFSIMTERSYSKFLFHSEKHFPHSQIRLSAFEILGISVKNKIEATSTLQITELKQL